MVTFLQITLTLDIPSCNIIAFLCAYFNLLSSIAQFFNFAKWRHSGPISSSVQCFSICHWNVHSIAAHNYAKSSVLTAYNLARSFDIIRLSETYLNSETPSNDTCLVLPGYTLFHSDHPFNNNRGGIFIFYKPTLPLRILNISNLDECRNFEVNITNKFSHFIQLYRSPSQKKDEFQAFKSNLGINIDAPSTSNPFLTVFCRFKIHCRFNAKSTNCY